MESSINEIIPPEILEMILLKLETQDLLRCRSVSKLWKTFASPICRDRHVATNFPGVFQNAEKIEAFFDTFENSSDLPWSACSIVLDRSSYSVDHEQFQRFFEAFGPHLRKLTLEGYNLVEPIILALHKIPNLEILIYDISDAKDLWKYTYSCGNSFKLPTPSPKRLQTVIRTEADVQLMEFFCKNTRMMESVSVNFKHMSNDGKLVQDSLRRVINIILGIPSITFYLSPTTSTVESFQMLSAPQLKLKELELKLPDGDAVEVEKFLTNNSTCLEKLIIHDLNRRGATGPFRLPILFKLKELGLYCDYISSSISTSSLLPFVSNQFPSLVKVWTQVRKVPGQDLTTVFGTLQFDSVKELTLQNYDIGHPNPMVIDWGHIFPNLVKLTLNGVTVESHSYIYEKMTKLEHLSLRVSPCAQMLGDPNTIICGYPKNIGNHGTAQNRSLASLKNLKTLFLDFNKYRDYPDSKIHLALLKLHRLDSLTFRNIEISMEVKEKLSDHHGEVNVQTGRTIF